MDFYAKYQLKQVDLIIRIFFSFFYIGFLAVYVPYVYLPGMTLEKGIDPGSTAFIISLIGVSNTVGRVVIGALGPDHLISFRHSKCTCVQNGQRNGNISTNPPIYLHWDFLKLCNSPV